MNYLPNTFKQIESIKMKINEKRPNCFAFISMFTYIY